ncbi:single-stranded DNA-binding protein [Methylotenera sp.]|uniref:single-stranded DNA-binding protein n=1 Tax=Methylotenera sp. TaxID=2051956 RepID=UPI0024892C02|nr:single-stranded DNA-binding protein [Methylotenera sp.]MDI1298604.1 single-stranded DNA-binding protein [Methylotenera sp.]
MNVCLFSGYVVRKFDLRKTSSNVDVVSYVIANNDVYIKDGKPVERVEFITVTSYGKQAVNDNKYLKKKSYVEITSRAVPWYDKATGKSGVNFVNENVKYIYSGKSEEGAEGASEDQQYAGNGLPEGLDDWVSEYNNAADPFANVGR